MPPELDVTLPVPRERRAVLDTRVRLGAFGNTMLAGLARLGADGHRKPVYVHDKLILVDDT